MPPGSRTSTRAVVPIRSLIRETSRPTTAALSGSASTSWLSTRTVSSSSRPGRVSTHWKYGASAVSARTSSSTWVGNTLTPRTIIMSSERPVIFSMRRNAGYADPGSRRVRSRVR